MKTPVLIALVFSLAGLMHAQVAPTKTVPSSATLPPGPWLKRAPVPSQWVVSYSRGPKEAAGAIAWPSQTPVDPSARKTVTVYKTGDILVEVTTRQNGSVVSRWRAGGLFLTQIGSGDNWFASTGGPENGFGETDYAKSDFPGFEWISEKNYVGIKTIGSQQCFVFHDKVVTLDPRELAAIRAEIQKSIDDWQLRQEELKSKPSSSAKAVETSAPRPFNIEDYKMDAEAAIDSATGLPVMLSYKTATGNETRTYQFISSAVSLSLPPAAQGIVAAEQARAKRLSRPPAIP